MSHSLDRRAVTSVITDLTGRSALLQTSQNVLSTPNENEEDSVEDLLQIAQEAEIVDDKKAKTSTTRETVIFLTAGAVAGALAKSSIAPFDRTKIYFQVTNSKFTLTEASSFLLRSYRKDGFLSLWRGNSATMARIVPYSAIQFASHERFKRLLGTDSKDRSGSTGLKFLAGSLAGVSSQAATYPLDLIRARMAVTPRKQFASMSQVLMSTCKTEGVFSLYKGFVPTLVGVIPYAGTSFATYETLKQYHAKKTGRELPSSLEKMCFGAAAGMFGQTASYPLDIVRRRMQTAQVTGNGHVYKSITQTLLYVYRTEGVVHGLYKGLSLNWVKGPICAGISFATFDTLKLHLHQQFPAEED